MKKGFPAAVAEIEVDRVASRGETVDLDEKELEESVY
jgi:hypothetical protein